MLFKRNKEKGNQDAVPDNSLKKIKTIINNLVTAGLLDLGQNIPSKWKLQINKKTFLEDNPLIVTSYAGLIAFHVTQGIEDTPEYPSILLYLLKNINERQKNHPLFQDKEYWIMIDEYPSIIYEADQKTPTFAYGRSYKLAREGRNARIGFVVIVQNFKDLPDGFQSLCNYFITFYVDKKNAEYAKEYNIPKENIQQISKLKQFEFLIATSTAEIALIHPDGETTYTTKPVKGTVYFPACKTGSPKSQMPI